MTLKRIANDRLAACAAAAAVLLAVVMTLGGGLGRAGAQEEPAERAPGVLEGDPATIDCAAEATAETAAATTFAILSDESEARYRAQEELASVGATEAVGATNAIIGQILFDEGGTPLACTRFDVDLRTLRSDEARRDNYLYGNTLETERYPLATFVLTEVEGLAEPLADGEEATFTLIGNMTVHGVTKLVAWQTTATLDGDTLEGSAATSFEMPDFNIEPPVIGPVVSLDETVRLEVDLTAERAA